jgi:hypothetical protein
MHLGAEGMAPHQAFEHGHMANANRTNPDTGSEFLATGLPGLRLAWRRRTTSYAPCLGISVGSGGHPPYNAQQGTCLAMAENVIATLD